MRAAFEVAFEAVLDALEDALGPALALGVALRLALRLVLRLTLAAVCVLGRRHDMMVVCSVYTIQYPDKLRLCSIGDESEDK